MAVLALSHQSFCFFMMARVIWATKITIPTIVWLTRFNCWNKRPEKEWGDAFAPSGHKVGPGPQLWAHQLIKGSCVNRRLSWFLSVHPKANFKDGALLKLLQLATLPASCASHFASHLCPAPPFMSGYYDGSEKNQFCLCCHWCLLVFFMGSFFNDALPALPFSHWWMERLVCVLCQPLALPQSSWKGRESSKAGTYCQTGDFAFLTGLVSL